MPRQHDRVSVSLEIILETASGNREARVSDLSRGGCFVDTIMDIAEGEKIIFRLKMPTGEWIKLSGKIAHRLPGFGFGIGFDLPLTDEQRTSIFRVIFAHGGKLSGYTDPRN